MLRFLAVLLFSGLSLCQAARPTTPPLIIDSNLTRNEALAGVAAACLTSVCKNQRLVDVRYYAFDGKIHQGQLVIDKSLVLDIQAVFDFALKSRFPMQSVIPMAAPQFRHYQHWDDGLSMAANNTSAFNYRLSTGGKQLSKHAYGRAIDINPWLNPYVKGHVTLPAGATYVPHRPGTLTADHPLES